MPDAGQTLTQAQQTALANQKSVDSMKTLRNIAKDNAFKELVRLYEREADKRAEINRLMGEHKNNSQKVLDILSKTETQIEANKKASQGWAEATGMVSDKLFGMSLPQMTIGGLLKKAAEVTIDWYNHTAKVNRQMYDISANLGEIGERGAQFEDSIRGTAMTLKVSHDEVRGVALGLAGIGFTTEEIATNLDEVYVLSRQWSEITPEKQMQLMSTYIKEFGMNGKEAWGTMFTLYETAQNLKDVMPKLDIKHFVDQTNEVAVSMRRYGLETQDAIALTSTLGRLGVEQARIPELAKTLGGIGLGTSEEMAFMSQRFLVPQMQADQAAGIAGGGLTGPASAEQMASRAERIRIAQSGAVGAIGVMATAEGGERTGAQMAMFETMLGAVGVKMTDPIEKVVGGLTAVDLPGIGKMGIQQAKEFAAAVKKLKEDEGVSLSTAIKEQLIITADETGKARKIAEDQKDTAAKAAAATITMAASIDIIKGDVGSLARRLVFGEDVGDLGKERAKAAIMGADDVSGYSDVRLASEAGISKAAARAMIGSGELQHMIKGKMAAQSLEARGTTLASRIEDFSSEEAAMRRIGKYEGEAPSETERNIQLQRQDLFARAGALSKEATAAEQTFNIKLDVDERLNKLIVSASKTNAQPG